MTIPSIEFWGIMQVAVDLCLIFLFVMMIRQIRSASETSVNPKMEEAASVVSSVLKEAKDVASQFEVQLKEKQRLIKKINERLDSRIIGLNLLLNRVDSVVRSKENISGKDGKDRDISKLQQEIMALSKKGLGTDMVADRLGVAKAEVELVMNLKRKFEEMERD